VTQRDEILRAVYEAGRFHKEHDAKGRAERGEGRVDVLGMIVKQDLPCIFRPLKGLLGAFLADPDRGVIVTTKRPLPIQRFTAAHELGHAVLGHEASLDSEEVLARALFSADKYDPREVQANAFATELLTPPWLIVQHMKTQGWTRGDLTKPDIVYQLSLRMGSSYSATSYALREVKAIDSATCAGLLKIKPRTIKQSLIEPYEPTSWYGDVWVVTERDNGAILEGSRTDLILFRLSEHASSGYIWQFGDLVDLGLALRRDIRAVALDQHVGGIVLRLVVAESEGPVTGRVGIDEVRPWLATDALNSMHLNIDFTGPIAAGLLPAQRAALLGVA